MFALILTTLFVIPGAVTYLCTQKSSQGMYFFLPMMGATVLLGLTTIYYNSEYYDGAPESAEFAAAITGLLGLSALSIFLAMILRVAREQHNFTKETETCDVGCEVSEVEQWKLHRSKRL